MNFNFEYDRGRITLQIPPEHVEIVRSSQGQVVPIVEIGDIVVPQKPGLVTVSIESFFWKNAQDKFGGPIPDAYKYVEWFYAWQESGKPARFVVEDLNHNFLVNCEGFNADSRANEEDDIYYKLQLKEYRPYGAKVMQVSPQQKAKAPAPVRQDNKAPVSQTYTVKPGDCLWHITKGMTGTTAWQELYNLNKGVIGNNPNLIKPGQQLVLPPGWGS